MNTNKGKYCCLPGCTSSSFTLDTSLFLISNGKNDIGVVLIQRNGAKIFFKFYFDFVTHQIRILEKNVLMDVIYW